jgi:DNA-3-methyladenine glycosylase II
MFAIFSLRRPDILPIGDLGVQKGLLNWVLSSHDPEKYPLCVNPRKLPQTNDDEPEKPGEAKAAEPGEDTSVLPAPTEASTSKSTAPAPAPAPKASSSKQPDGTPLVPTKPVPLPEGITLETLKARANGKKAKGGCYLLPGEMEALTASWKPYRSLGEFFLGFIHDSDLIVLV